MPQKLSSTEIKKRLEQFVNVPQESFGPNLGIITHDLRSPINGLTFALPDFISYEKKIDVLAANLFHAHTKLLTIHADDFSKKLSKKKVDDSLLESFNEYSSTLKKISALKPFFSELQERKSGDEKKRCSYILGNTSRLEGAIEELLGLEASSGFIKDGLTIHVVRRHPIVNTDPLLNYNNHLSTDVEVHKYVTKFMKACIDNALGADGHAFKGMDGEVKEFYLQEAISENNDFYIVQAKSNGVEISPEGKAKIMKTSYSTKENKNSANGKALEQHAAALQTINASPFFYNNRENGTDSEGSTFGVIVPIEGDGMYRQKYLDDYFSQDTQGRND